LAAYCRLVTAAYGRRPPYGILHYSNRTYAIDFTPELENKLLEEAEEIRQREHQAQVDRSHESWQRCRACGYRSICDQKLISHQRTML
jgi:CRISPR-associated exonuclease Cas4